MVYPLLRNCIRCKTEFEANGVCQISQRLCPGCVAYYQSRADLPPTSLVKVKKSTGAIIKNTRREEDE